ncbi:MAG: hypothetical protein LBR48_06900 [Dysgonamonadaceae bacterium]|jgi:hypothetical protein|nr:hypothetical protein [Dysgonamonadaceae bacterium]
MGKLILFLIFGFLLLTLLLGVRAVARIFRVLFGFGRSPEKTYRSKQRTQAQEPETQEDRIISYQKKSFESIPPEDVDFEEMKKEE